MPRILDSLYIVSYFINWTNTFWAYSITNTRSKRDKGGGLLHELHTIDPEYELGHSLTKTIFYLTLPAITIKLI